MVFDSERASARARMMPLDEDVGLELRWAASATVGVTGAGPSAVVCPSGACRRTRHAREALVAQKQAIVGPLVEDRAADFVAARK